MRRTNALFNSGNLDALFETYHPDVEFRDLLHPPDLPEVLHGRDGIRLALSQWADVYEEFRAEVYEYIDAHPWVICDTRWYGKGKGSEVVVDVRSTDAWKVEKGKVVRWTVGYPNVATALADLGLAGSAMSQENVEIVHEAFSAFSVGGIEAVLPFYATDVVLHSTAEWPDDPVYRGHDGARRLAAAWTENFDEFRFTVGELRAHGEHVAESQLPTDAVDR